MPADTNRAAYERAGYVPALHGANGTPGGEPVLRTGETEVRSEEELEVFSPNGPWMTRIPKVSRRRFPDSQAVAFAVGTNVLWRRSTWPFRRAVRLPYGW